MTRLVTVASYLYPTDAHLARARLEAAGIPCLLANEHLAQIQWSLTNALHGIQAQVPEDHAAAALRILQDDVNHSLEAWLAFEREEAEAAQGEKTAKRGGTAKQAKRAEGKEASARSAAAVPDKSGGTRREAAGSVVGRPDRAGDGIAEFLAETPEGVCPRCRSANVARRELGRVLKVLIVFLLFFSPLPDRRRRFRCRDCGWRW